jgi:hypothetical protein
MEENQAEASDRIRDGISQSIEKGADSIELIPWN